MPIESIQRTRFFRARILMMCVLLVGSPFQSWAKQTIDWPSSMNHLRDGRRLLVVEEEPLPDLEIGQEPEPLAVVGVSRQVLLAERPKDGRLEEPAGKGAGTQDELVDDRPAVAQPPPQGDRK